MATLVKQSGRYYCQFYHKDRTPARKKISLKTSRKREAEKLLRKLEADYLRSEFDPWTDDPLTYDREIAEEPLSLKEALARFVEKKKEEDYSHHTIKTYRKVIRRVMQEASPEKRVDQLTHKELNAYVRQEDVAQATKDRRFRHIRAFVNWALERGYAAQNPLEGYIKPKRPKKMPKHVTPAELEAICTEIRKDWKAKLEEGKIRDGEIIWLAGCFRFAFYSGLRGEELARLRWKHLDFERGLILLFEQKNGEESAVPLLDKAREALSLVPKGEGEDFVFRPPRKARAERNFTTYRTYLSKRFKLYREKAGIERRITLHGCRHGFATALAEAGKSAATIKAACRHKSIDTSMKYIHLSQQHVRSELQDVFGE